MAQAAASELPAELLERARRGDAGALGRLAERYREALLERVRLMLGQEARGCAESLDFVQGAILEALRRQPEGGFASERDLLRWMTAAARNDIRNAVRRRRERALASLSASLSADALVGETPSPASEACHNEELLCLLEALEGLSSEHRRVIELRDLEELSFVDVGRRLGRSEAAAQMLHTRALVRLGKAMRDG